MRMRMLMFLLCLVSKTMLTQVPVVEPATYGSYASDALVQQWLESSDPRLVAWAGAFVLQQQQAGMVPRLVDRMTHWRAPTESKSVGLGWPYAQAVLLDTILQMDGTVPAKVLDRLEDSASTQRFLLLARLPWTEALPVWESMYHPERRDARWDAIRVSAQMLARQPPPGFAAQLLASVAVRGHIIVRAPASGPGMDRFGDGSCGSSLSRDTSRWPPVGSYLLHDPLGDGSPPPSDWKIFIEAPDPIYVQRLVGPGLIQAPCGQGLRPLNDALRSHLVGILLAGTPVSPFPEKEQEVNILLPGLANDRQKYRAQVTDWVETQEANFAWIAGALTARSLMTEEERQASVLHITMWLTDLRPKPAVDLPSLVFPGEVSLTKTDAATRTKLGPPAHP